MIKNGEATLNAMGNLTGPKPQQETKTRFLCTFLGVYCVVGITI